MKTVLNSLLRYNLYAAISEDDVVSRQRFMLFRIFSFTGMFACLGVFCKMYFTIHNVGPLPFFILGLGILLLFNFYFVEKVKNLQKAYAAMLFSAFALLHMVSYSCGGIRTAGTMYFSVVILYSFMLLGNRAGKWFTALVIAHVIYLFFISTYTNLASFDFFKNDNAFINQDYLTNAVLTFFLIASQSSYLQSGKNVIIQRLEKSKMELEEKNNSLKQKNRLMKQYALGLEKSNRELDKFASVASHDLKAPLRAIGALTGMIEEDAGAEMSQETREHFNTIKSRVNRMEQLLNALLEYSKTDRLKGEETVFDSRLLAEEAGLLLATGNNIQLTVSPKLPVISADRKKLKTAFCHLIQNAIIHNDKEIKNIEIDCFEKFNSWEFSVKDNGPGIEPAFHDKIFIIFQTLNRRDDLDTMGAGLAITKKIIEETGGSIRVECQPGKGACFVFSIPKANKPVLT